MDPKLTQQVVLHHNDGVPCEDVSERRRIVNEHIMECIPVVAHPLVNKLKECVICFDLLSFYFIVNYIFFLSFHKWLIPWLLLCVVVIVVVVGVVVVVVAVVVVLVVAVVAVVFVVVVAVIFIIDFSLFICCALQDIVI